MAESVHYFYGQDHLQHGHSETYYDSALPQSSSLAMAAYYQPELSQRKRPKYTRSKTGCMTCRQKKVKCDEEKPDCARCRAGGRDCVWPDGGTTRKRTARRDTRASHSHSPSVDAAQAPTGGSASPSIASTPPSRPKAEPVDFPLPQATPHSVSTGLRYPTEVDHYKSHIVPDVREYTEPRQSPSTAASIANTLQYHVREHTSTPSQSYSQATPSEHYAQSVSYAHNQTPLYQYPEAHLIKPENDEGWQAAMSQHVDPIHPFAFPTMQAYYTASRECTLPVAAQAPHGHLAYPYMKYH